jgi:hypothetical protein
LVVVLAVVAVECSYAPMIPESTSLRTGQMFFDEIHDTENHNKFLSQTRMEQVEDFDEMVRMFCLADRLRCFSPFV